MQTVNAEPKKVTKKEATRLEREADIARLREWLPPGSTVYTVLRHVSRSGMMRRIDLYAWIKDDNGEPMKMYLSGYAAKAIGERCEGDGIKVSGCGMDMGFHLVYNLSRVLYQQGFNCARDGCPSCDHSNRYYMERDGSIPAGTCRDHIERRIGVCHDKVCKPWHHSDGGYALKHSWI